MGWSPRDLLNESLPQTRPDYQPSDKQERPAGSPWLGTARSAFPVNEAVRLEAVRETLVCVSHWLSAFNQPALYGCAQLSTSEASDVEITLKGRSAYLSSQLNSAAPTASACLPAGIPLLDTVKHSLQAQQKLLLPVHQELLGVLK